jgi:hypothetical protein
VRYSTISLVLYIAKFAAKETWNFIAAKTSIPYRIVSRDAAGWKCEQLWS